MVDATVVGIIQWFNQHPILAILAVMFFIWFVMPSSGVSKRIWPK
jgi:hypothetical protein